MQGTWCPRCGRRHGVRLVFGYPGPALSRRAARGAVRLGGCMPDPDAPRARCASCGSDSHDGPLPPWWPPRPAASLSRDDRQSAEQSLRDRVERTAGVVEALRRGGVPAGRAALTELLAALPAPGHGDGEVGGDGGGDSVDVAAGIESMVVPSDLVLLAEVLDAAVLVCRAVEAYPEQPLIRGPLRVLTVPRAVREFEEAEQTWRERGRVDFAAMPADERVAAMVDEYDRLESLVRSGEGTEEPDAGPAWDDDLAEPVPDAFGSGSSISWVRYVWSHLPPAPLTTDLDMARARVRLLSLALLRRTVLDLLDGGGADERRGRDMAPFSRLPHLSLLVAAESIETGPTHDGGTLDVFPASDAVDTLVRRESARLWPVVVDQVGADELMALIWASGYDGARYPLAAATVEEALHRNPAPGIDAARQWLAEGAQA